MDVFQERIANLIVQLSGVRSGQNDYGRVKNVSGYLLEWVLNVPIDLNNRKHNALVSESAQVLRRSYELFLDRQYRTKEAARLAIKDELNRLIEKYNPSLKEQVPDF